LKEKGSHGDRISKAKGGGKGFEEKRRDIWRAAEGHKLWPTKRKYLRNWEGKEGKLP